MSSFFLASAVSSTTENLNHYKEVADATTVNCNLADRGQYEGKTLDELFELKAEQCPYTRDQLRQLLAAYLGVGATAEGLQYAALYQSRNLSEPFKSFGFVETLWQLGWTHEELKAFLASCLWYVDPNCTSPDLLYHFLRFQHNVWELMSARELVAVVERALDRYDSDFAHVIVGGAKEFWRCVGEALVRAGEATVDEHLSPEARMDRCALLGKGYALQVIERAVHKLSWVPGEKALDVILGLKLQVQEGVLRRATARKIPNRFEAALALNLILEWSDSSRLTEQARQLLLDFIGIKKDGLPLDYPVRAFRWLMGCAKSVPLTPVPSYWQRSYTKESYREYLLQPFVAQWLKAVETAGWRVVTLEESEHQGRRQLVATLPAVRPGGIAKRFVHDEPVRGSRYERLSVGDRVFVFTGFMNNQPLFKGQGFVGWKEELHPLAPLTDSFLKTLEGTTGLHIGRY